MTKYDGTINISFITLVFLPFFVLGYYSKDINITEIINKIPLLVAIAFFCVEFWVFYKIFYKKILIIFAKIAHISFYSISSTHILLYIVFLLFILLDIKYAVQELTQTALTEFKGTSQYAQSVCLKDKYYQNNLVSFFLQTFSMIACSLLQKKENCTSYSQL